MKKYVLLSFLLLVTSCSKMGYMIKQSWGQLKLEYSGDDVDEVIKKAKLDEGQKAKLKLILKAKAYFYHYFNLEKTPIYQEYSQLEQDAVSYLVIISPWEKVEAIKHSFPFAGEFPYLGFFQRDDAKEFADEWRAKNYATYTRPVYAYSTLNRLPFYDNILSSFFYFDEQELVELIFHELTHTVIFFDGEVDFNEMFADFIAEQLLYDYFNFSDADKEIFLAKRDKQTKLKKIIHQWAKAVQTDLTKRKEVSENESKDLILKIFNDSYSAQLQDLCEEDLCGIKGADWNTARLAAFLTYADTEFPFDKLLHQTEFKNIFTFIEKEYEHYEETDGSISFKKYLRTKDYK